LKGYWRKNLHVIKPNL